MASCIGSVIPALRAGPHTGRPWRRLSGGAVVPVARLVDLVGALARPLAAGAGTAPGGVQLVGNLRPREAGAAVLDDGRVRFLLALVPFPAPAALADLAHCGHGAAR